MEAVLALSHLQAESRRLPMDFRKSCIDSRLRGPASALDNGDILALGAQGVAFVFCAWDNLSLTAYHFPP